MVIVCPSCASTYTLTSEQLGRGRTVRCARCRHTWYAKPPAEERAPAARPAEPALAAAGAPPQARLARRGKQGSGANPVGSRRKGHLAGLASALRRGSSRLSVLARPAPLAALAVVVGLGIAVAERRAVVWTLPQTARLFAAIGLPVNLRGLEFAEVRSGLVDESGQTVLVLEGEIRNVEKTPVELAALSLQVRDPAGQVLYTWTAEPPAPVLASGESAPFRTRLVSPPADGHDVLVRFAPSSSAVAGEH